MRDSEASVSLCHCIGTGPEPIESLLVLSLEGGSAGRPAVSPPSSQSSRRRHRRGKAKNTSLYSSANLSTAWASTFIRASASPYSAATAKPKATEFQDALEVGESHLDAFAIAS